MRSVLEEVVRYLVIERLAGRSWALEVAVEYFIRNSSPSRIASKVGVSKYAVKRVIDSIRVKSGSHAVAVALVKALRPYVESVRPIVVVSDGGRPYCRLCGCYINADHQYAYQHVVWKHRDLVSRLTSEIVGALLRRR